jgi:hypothetical protein
MDEQEYPPADGPVYGVLAVERDADIVTWRCLPLGTRVVLPFQVDCNIVTHENLVDELAALRGAARCHINQWPMQPDEAAAWNRALDPC